ncbi:MAG TPA: FAD-binding oxidoreductase, partial [Polyangiaceae bacterium]|nr:FAD-binding oxidoreductase [Polyangiaceae bacterium]
MQLDAALREVVPGARVSSLAPDLAAYARDLWPRRLIELQAREPIAERPAAVVWPESVEHVSALVGFARRQGIALVPFGAGSGVCGAIEAVRGSIVVDVKRFASFSIGHGPELDSGAGVLGITLEEALLEAGYTTGHYPSSILCSTVGGWAAARGAGQCSGRYGKIEDMVTFVEAVLGRGEVLRAQRRAQGPDLVPLLIGSEGTLGIITRVGLRLHPAPAARAFSAFAFDSMQEGMQALRLLYQSGLRPSVARL